MDLAALVLLDDNPDAVKLVATWPVVGVQVTSEDLLDGEMNGGVDRWASVSGVDIDDIMRLIPMLFGNDILRPEGHVDNDAMTYIKAPVAARLKRKVGS